MLNKINSLLHNKTARDGSIFAFFSFLNRGLNFILLIILSWYILPSSYGQLNIFYTLVGVVAHIISLCTPGIVGIKYFKVSRKELSQYINVFLSTTAFVSAILLLLIAVFPEYLQKISGISTKFQILCVYFCVTAVVYNLSVDMFIFEEKSIKYGIITTCSTLINICASLFLVAVMKQDWMGRIEAHFVSSTIFFIFGLFLLIKKKYITSNIPSKEQYKETLAYGIPLIPHNCNAFLRQGMDRYIINSHFSATPVGLFSFTINFASIIYTAGVAFNASSSVYVFKNLAEGGDNVKSKLRKQTILLLFFYLGLTMLLIGVCHLLIPLIFPNYKESVIYLFPLCMSTFFQCVSLQFCNFLFYFKKTKQLMYMTVSVSIIHLGLSLLLTQYSVLYTAYISMFSSGIEAALVYWYTRRTYKFI